MAIAAATRRVVTAARRLFAAPTVRLGRLLGIVTSTLLYLTLFAPFGLLSRCAGHARGWRPPRSGSATLAALRGPA